MKKALVLGGTRFMGRHLVKRLLETGWDVTIATRGQAKDDLGDRVNRLIVDRQSRESLEAALSGKSYDVAFDSIAYCSNDVKALLDVVDCKQYVEISTVSVYEGVGNGLHMDTREEEFDPSQGKLVYCNREDFSYEEIKRQAERAIVQDYPGCKASMARFPYVIGTDDYTNRLYFYVEHIVGQKPMWIDTPEAKITFVRSDEAGEFLAFLGERESVGTINGASSGTVTMGEVVAYVEKKTGLKAVISPEGEPAPYNNEQDYSLNTEKAEKLGYTFTPLEDWIWQLIDGYIKRAESER